MMTVEKRVAMYRDRMANQERDLAQAWKDIYVTFPDNAFDYLGKPFHMNDGSIKMWNGETQSMTTYVEVPF